MIILRTVRSSTFRSEAASDVVNVWDMLGIYGKLGKLSMATGQGVCPCSVAALVLQGGTGTAFRIMMPACAGMGEGEPLPDVVDRATAGVNGGACRQTLCTRSICS